MNFEWTFTAGNVIELVITLGSIIGGYIRISNRIVVMETKVEAMWKVYERRMNVGKDP